MINLLRKIFIKNYNDIAENNVREKHGILAAFVGIISNLILFAIKIVAGILSSSISIIADSINNLSDMGSSVITLIGFKMSNKPADEEHPFGHGRIEYISGLIVAVIILFVGFQMAYQSFGKIMKPSEVSYSAISIIILSVSILIKLWQGLFNKKIGRLIDSIAIGATAQDSLNDSITTLTLLVAAIISMIFKFNIDGYLGIFVSLFIIISGIKLIKEATNPLIGISPDGRLVQRIINDIKAEKDVLGIHDVVCHMYGPTKCFMTVHAEVNADGDFIYLHDVIDNIEMRVRRKYDVELVIHMDPINFDDEETIQLKNKVINILNNVDKELSIHDFRIVRGHTHTNILFDIVIPRKYKYSAADLNNILKENFGNSKLYNFIITIDYNYYVRKED